MNAASPSLFVDVELARAIGGALAGGDVDVAFPLAVELHGVAEALVGGVLADEPVEPVDYAGVGQEGDAAVFVFVGIGGVAVPAALVGAC